MIFDLFPCQCQSAGVAGCCCGKCGGYYKAHSAKTLSLVRSPLPLSFPMRISPLLRINRECMDFSCGKRLSLVPTTHTLKLRYILPINRLIYRNNSIQNPNFLFARCCAERELPRACAAKCSHHTYTQTAVSIPSPLSFPSTVSLSLSVACHVSPSRWMSCLSRS